MARCRESEGNRVTPASPGIDYVLAGYCYGVFTCAMVHSLTAMLREARARKDIRGRVRLGVAPSPAIGGLKGGRLKYRRLDMGYTYGDLGDKPFQMPEGRSKEIIPRVALEENTTEQQLSLKEALASRDAVMEEQSERHKGWMSLASDTFLRLPADWSGIGEDLRFALTENGVPAPKTPNVWGVFVGLLVRRGLLVATGERRPMTAPGSNGRRSDVYCRVLATETAA